MQFCCCFSIVVSLVLCFFVVVTFFLFVCFKITTKINTDLFSTVLFSVFPLLCFSVVPRASRNTECNATSMYLLIFVQKTLSNQSYWTSQLSSCV